MNDNELVFFDEAARDLPASVAIRARLAADELERVVEYHPWAPLSAIEHHVITAVEGCAEHGIECGAYATIKAASPLGWDAFK